MQSAVEYKKNRIPGWHSIETFRYPLSLAQNSVMQVGYPAEPTPHINVNLQEGSGIKQAKSHRARQIDSPLPLPRRASHAVMTSLCLRPARHRLGPPLADLINP